MTVALFVWAVLGMVDGVEDGLTCIIRLSFEVVVAGVGLVVEAMRGVETPIGQGNVLDCCLSDGTRVAAWQAPAHG